MIYTLKKIFQGSSRRENFFTQLLYTTVVNTECSFTTMLKDVLEFNPMMKLFHPEIVTWISFTYDPKPIWLLT